MEQVIYKITICSSKHMKKLFNYTIFIICFIINPVVNYYSFASSLPDRICQNSTHSLSEFEKMDHKNIVELTEIPNNLLIENHKFHFTVYKTSVVHLLPSRNSFISAVLRAQYEDIAVCRVQDYAEQWWYVLKDPIGGLSYINGEYLRIEKINNAKE